MFSLTVGLMIGSADLMDEVRAALQGGPFRVTLEQREFGDLAVLAEKLERAQADVVIIALHQLPAPLEEIIRNIKAVSGSPMVIVVHSSSESDVILKSVRAGADEFVYSPLADRLRTALERMSATRAKLRAGTRPRGKVFGFVSAKGGCGATTLACHLAVELHRQTHLEVLVGDFDLDSGLIGFLMKSASRYSVMDALDNVNRLDLSFWKALVSNGYPGVEVISAPPPSGMHRPNLENLRHVVPFVRANYDWTVLDLGRGLSQTAMNVVEELDETFIVTTLDIPALHQAKQMVQSLLDKGYGQHRLRLILNRTPKRTEVTLEELDRMLGVPIYATVPNDYPSLNEAYSDSTLLAPNTQLGRHFARIAARMAGLPQREKKKGFLGLST